MWNEIENVKNESNTLIFNQGNHQIPTMLFSIMIFIILNCHEFIYSLEIERVRQLWTRR